MSYPEKNKYKDTELKEIQNLIKTKLSDGAKNVSQSTFSDICFHPSEPRVGFLDTDKPVDSQKWLKVQEMILDFASRYKFEGCHVCLVLDDNTYGK